MKRTPSPYSGTLPPLVRLLDPREREDAAARPILDSVNIPLSELPDRVHELPTRHQTVLLAPPGPAAERALDWLHTHGRKAEIAHDAETGDPGNGRLWRPNAFLEETAKAMVPGRAIDLGCGTGRDAVALAAWGWDVVAADLLPDALERARALEASYAPAGARPVDWRVADLERGLSGLGADYDLVVAFFFYHPALVQQATLLLRPGGSLLLEAFTPAHGAAKGKPAADRVADPDVLPALVAPLEVRSMDAAWRADRHTARLWAARRVSK